MGLGRFGLGGSSRGVSSLSGPGSVVALLSPAGSSWDVSLVSAGSSESAAFPVALAGSA